MPSVSYASEIIRKLPSTNEINSFLWLKENTEEDDVVLAGLNEGYLINTVAERKNVFDNNFILIKDAEQRLNDVKTIYTTIYETEAIPLLNKYNIRYIVISKEVMEDYGVIDINYKSDEKCFYIVYDESVKIYKSVCRMD